MARLGGALVRPHDLVVGAEPESGAVQAQVTRVVHLGFEVRLELALAGEGQLAAQLTRSEVEQLEVAPGDIVYVRSDGDARRFPRAAPAPAQAQAAA